MKKGILIALLLAMAVSAGGCSKKENADSAGGTNTAKVTDTAKPTSDTQVDGNAQNGDTAQNDGGQQTAGESGSSSGDDFAVNADQNVDMDAVEGEYATENKEAEVNPKAELGVFEVAVKEAKVFQYEDGNYIVFTIDFKNNSSAETSFSTVMEAKAFQDGLQIAPATFPGFIEGIDTATTAQKIKEGEEITVQKVYVLADTTTPVEIQVRPFYEDTTEVVSQMFDIQ